MFALAFATAVNAQNATAPTHKATPAPGHKATPAPSHKATHVPTYKHTPKPVYTPAPAGNTQANCTNKGQNGHKACCQDQIYTLEDCKDTCQDQGMQNDIWTVDTKGYRKCKCSTSAADEAYDVKCEDYGFTGSAASFTAAIAFALTMALASM